MERENRRVAQSR
jgi:hypothetical protein